MIITYLTPSIWLQTFKNGEMYTISVQEHGATTYITYLGNGIIQSSVKIEGEKYIVRLEGTKAFIDYKEEDIQIY